MAALRSPCLARALASLRWVCLSTLSESLNSQLVNIPRFIESGWCISPILADFYSISARLLDNHVENVSWFWLFRESEFAKTFVCFASCMSHELIALIWFFFNECWSVGDVDFFFDGKASIILLVNWSCKLDKSGAKVFLALVLANIVFYVP